MTASTFTLYNIDALELAESPSTEGGVTTDAKGSTEITYIPALNLVAAKLSYSNLGSDLVGFHIHAGNASTNGPVMVNFCSQSPLPSALTNDTAPCVQQAANASQWYLGTIQPPFNKSQVYTQLTRDTADTYVNLHSEQEPNGIIRQQDSMGLTVKLEKTTTAKKHKLYAYDFNAAPLEQLPNVTNISTTATGSASIFFIPSTGLIVARVKYEGITDQVIGMHLHTGNASVNGAPVVVFCGDSPLPGVLVNFTVPCVQQEPGQTVTYIGNYVQGVDPASVREMLLTAPEETYFNIHDLTSFQEVGTNGLIRQQLDEDAVAAERV